MASISSVLTRGLGSWGSTSLRVTLGFGVGTEEEDVVAGPYYVAANQYFVAGMVANESFTAGHANAQSYVAGAKKGDYL